MQILFPRISRQTTLLYLSIPLDPPTSRSGKEIKETTGTLELLRTSLGLKIAIPRMISNTFEDLERIGARWEDSCHYTTARNLQTGRRLGELHQTLGLIRSLKRLPVWPKEGGRSARHRDGGAVALEAVTRFSSIYVDRDRTHPVVSKTTSFGSGLWSGVYVGCRSLQGRARSMHRRSVSWEKLGEGRELGGTTMSTGFVR